MRVLRKMRVICLSDTHTTHGQFSVPDGDLLLHAGDFSMMGRESEIRSFNAWLGTLPHKHKVVIAGNHDWMLQRDPPRARSLLTRAIYLEDSGVEIEGLRIWGSPWQPWFLDWAFNLQRGKEIAAKWALIPTGVDILITHGPPANILDRCPDGQRVGCADLVRELARIRPHLHVFGHIHDAYGIQRDSATTYVNAAICNEAYDPANAPIVIDL